MAGASVALKGIAKAYGGVPVLADIDLAVEPGEFLTLLGPSGCGKSTLLRLIAGFETATRGHIEISGTRVDGLRPKERGLSMVFQNYALYPHLSVFDNIAMPLVMRQLSFLQRFPVLGRLVPGSGGKTSEIRKKVVSVARLLEIDGLLDRRPGQLSGGQRQRVALGRAIAPEPSLFLMDEPLSNLDARLRIQMRSELTELHRRLGITFVYVTHDQVEAMTMSQRVALIMEGRLVQVGTPSEVYRRPADLRVATFIGAHPINVCGVQISREGRAMLFGQVVPHFTDNVSTVAFRPEDASLEATATITAGTISFPVTASRIEDHGGELLVRVEPTTGQPLLVSMPPSFRTVYDGVGVRAVRLSMPVDALHCFDHAGKRVDATSGKPASQHPRTAARSGNE